MRSGVRVIALDVGSSSVKAAVLAGGRIAGKTARAPFATTYDGPRAEVRPADVEKAIAVAMRQLPATARRADLVALCTMAPSWLAMDRRGRAITPIVTHQDRRSVVVAQALERRIGMRRYLQITGNRPFPGGMSSTTAAWFARHEAGVMRRADLTGHLNTYLLQKWTGARVTDPSNASFMGVYQTTTLRGWSEQLADAVGLKISQLPEVMDGAEVAGRLTAAGAAVLGLPEGMPVLPGIMDTSAAAILCGTKHGTLLNVSGSTDVLALCVDKPKPHERLLTRAVGTGRKWMAVSTLASAGTTLSWLRQTLFSELSDQRFYALVERTVSAGNPRNSVSFQPYLAGDRLSVEQRQGALTGLTLATTRENLLYAAIDALAKASGERIPLFQEVYGRVDRLVHVSGGVGVALARVLHRDWQGRWQFRAEKEMTLRGLYRLAEDAVG